VRTGSRHRVALLLITAVLWATACDAGDPRPSAGTTLPSPTSVTSTPSERPVGPGTSLPWWSAGYLHVDGGLFPTTMRRIVTSGGTTIVGRQTREGSSWEIVRGGRLVELSRPGSGAEPVLSANGRYAAWTTSVDTHRYNLYEADTTFTVTAYDVGSGTVTGATVIESRTSCCDGGGSVYAAGIDNDGTVVLIRYDVPGRVVAWLPGRDPVDVRGIRDATTLTFGDQWPGGVSFQQAGVGDSSGPAVFARVMPGGGLSRRGRVPQAQGGVWSPDGASYAYRPFTKFADYPPEVWSHGRQVRLQAHDAIGIVGWEDRHSVIVLAKSPASRLARRGKTLLRCDARSGRCEQAGPVLHGAILPDLAF
jgi:hypothetical protein